MIFVVSLGFKQFGCNILSTDVSIPCTYGWSGFLGVWISTSNGIWKSFGRYFFGIFVVDVVLIPPLVWGTLMTPGCGCGARPPVRCPAVPGFPTSPSPPDSVLGCFCGRAPGPLTVPSLWAHLSFSPTELFRPLRCVLWNLLCLGEPCPLFHPPEPAEHSLKAQFTNSIISV